MTSTPTLESHPSPTSVVPPRRYTVRTTPLTPTASRHWSSLDLSVKGPGGTAPPSQADLSLEDSTSHRERPLPRDLHSPRPDLTPAPLRWRRYPFPPLRILGSQVQRAANRSPRGRGLTPRDDGSGAWPSFVNPPPVLPELKVSVSSHEPRVSRASRSLSCLPLDNGGGVTSRLASVGGLGGEWALGAARRG